MGSTPEEPQRTFAFQILFGDLLWYVAGRQLTSFVLVSIVGLLAPLLVVRPWQAPPGREYQRQMVFLATAAFTIALLAIYIGFRTVYFTIGISSKALLAPTEFSYDEAGFRFHSEFATIDCRWSILHKVTRTPRLLCLWYGRYGMYLVPRRAFPDQAAWDECYRYCVQQWRRDLAS